MRQGSSGIFISKSIGDAIPGYRSERYLHQQTMTKLWDCASLVLVLAFSWKLACVCMRWWRAKLIAKIDPLFDPFLAVNDSIFVLEFPFLGHRSLEMGTLRTFAIPSISRTLCKGGEYARNTTKRYDDTEILLQELVMHHVDSPRGSSALRRLNFLHSHYAISNADYLYVLCIFVLLPIEWVSMYGYRKFTESEKSSTFKVWHDIGTRMGIRNIPPTIAAMAAYRDDYEAKFMVYAESNHEIAELNMKVLLQEMPALLQSLVRRLVYALMDDRLREALGYPRQPWWLSTLLHSLMKMHGVVVSWMPPRPLAWAARRIYPDCPALISVCKSEEDAAHMVRPLAFHRYKPITYAKGYRIAELGGLKPGKMGEACVSRELLCPLERCSRQRPM